MFCFGLVFRAMVLGWHSELSHCSFPVWRSEPLPIFVSTFRATTYLRFSTQSPVLFHFGVQSHVLFHLMFRATSLLGVLSHYISHSSVQSHVLFHLMFMATSSFGVQSHYIIHFGAQSHVLLRFGIQSHIFVRHSELRLCFGVQSHHLFSFRRSKPLLIFYLAFGAVFSVQHLESSCLSFIHPSLLS